MLVALLHFIPDEDKPAEIVATLLDALPSGSYLVASHLTMEHDTDAAGGGLQAMRGAGISMQKRASDEFARLAFSGLELVPPGRGARLRMAAVRRGAAPGAGRGQLLRRGRPQAVEPRSSLRLARTQRSLPWFPMHRGVPRPGTIPR